jgi:Zn-dependent peptidase ImmA (M78 family)
VLINRHEVVGRRHFDLAHELFHILTWDAMPPEHSEEARETGGNRVEQLANSFASAVLMPTSLLDRYGDWSALRETALVEQLNEAAPQMQVTASALKWRLVALDRLKPAAARAISDAALRNNGRDAGSATPALFSKPFAEVIALSIDQGRVSTRRAAALVDLTIDDLTELFAHHGVQSPIDM